MKSKKIIASLMALSIVGSSSFVLGGTAKAATLNGTSSKSVSSSWTNYKLQAQINFDGYLYWCKITGATEHRFDIMTADNTQRVFSGDGGENYLEEDGIANGFKRFNRKAGKYSVTVKALDSSKNIITQETFYFYYDGVGRYTMQ